MSNPKSRNLIDEVKKRYEIDAKSEDPITRAVAERQLAAVEKGLCKDRSQNLPRSSPQGSTGARPSKWRHVPLAELFEQQGNHLLAKSDGRFECGHEPMHGSKSGRCLSFDPRTGRWWCRSCGEWGDAATYIMELFACGYWPAARWLAARYGPPL